MKYMSGVSDKRKMLIERNSGARDWAFRLIGAEAGPTTTWLEETK